MKKYRLWGGACAAHPLDAMGRKIIFLIFQAELIRETSIILNTHHLYMENYFAFGNHMKYGCTQAPPLR